MNSLISKKCKPCKGEMLLLDEPEVRDLRSKINDEWDVELRGEEGARFGKSRLLKKEFGFSDFREALEFVNKVAELAEAEGHHPNIHMFYNKVVLELTTHAVGGLSKNDFILAAKIDEM